MFGLTAIECFVAIIIIYIAVFWITPRKHMWFPFLLVVVLLAVLAHRVTPNDSDDLTRYFAQLNYLRDYGHDYLQRCIDEGINGWDVYRVAGYYFYFFSKFSDNYLLPAFTIFISYGLSMLVFYKFANKFFIEKSNVFFGTIFFLSTYWYYDTLAGIRNGLAFAVIMACAYYHLVERKYIPLCYLGYALVCLMHSAGIILVVLIIFTELTLNTSGKFLNILLVFGFIVGGAGIQFLADRSDSSFLQSLSSKVDNNAAGESISTQTNFLVNVATYALVAIMIIYFSKYILNSNYALNLKRLYKLSSIIMFFMIGCLYSTLIFLRFARWIIPVIGAFMFMIGAQSQSDEIKAIEMEKESRYFTFNNRPLSIKLKPFVFLVMISYTTVHFWYLCTGSSLYWMHF